VRTQFPADRRALGLLAILSLAGAAGCDPRDRPSPSESDAAVQLSVEVVSPRDGATVVAGRPLAIQVRARDLRGQGVTAVGFVVRRLGGAGAAVDSVAHTLFSPTAETTQDFEMVVPATFITNTHLEVFGIAFGARSAVRISVPRAVVVARCEPPQPCG
jgi:hypothetical protein